MSPARVLLAKRARPTGVRLALLVNAGLILAGGAWMSRLAPYLYYILVSASLPLIKPRLLVVLLFLVGAALGALGASWLYPLTPPLLMALLYAYGAPQASLEVLGAEIVAGVALMVSLSFAQRYLRVGGASIPRGRVSWWLAAILIVVGAFAGYALLLKVIVEGGVELLLRVVSTFPYTLREFYTIVTETRVGLGFFVAIVVAVGIRVMFWISSPLLEGLTASPSTSLREVGSMVKAEVGDLLYKRSEASTWISIGISTTLSLAVLPVLGSLSAVLDGVFHSLPRHYPRILAVLVSIIVYALLWESLRRLTYRLSPGILAADVRGIVRPEAKPQADVLRDAITVLVGRTVLGIVAALAVVVAINYFAAMAVEGHVSMHELLHTIARGIAGGSEPYSLLIDRYAQAYSRYLSTYVENLDKLLDIVIRLLWGR